MSDGRGRVVVHRTFRPGAWTSSGELGQGYGVTDLDGSTPDAWRYLVEVQDPGKTADTTGFR